MWTLIKREAKDVILFATLPSLFVAIIVAYLAFEVHHISRKEFDVYGSISLTILGTCWAPLIILPSIAGLLGVYQIRWDRIRGISTFLATQPTSRERILMAKIIIGVISLALWLITLTLIYLWTNYKLPHFQPGVKTFIINSMSTCGIFVLAVYTLGLLLAQHCHILISICATLLLAGLLFLMLAIKGLNPQTNILFIIISIVTLYRAWRQFMTATL